jgi:hypothetical protein
MARTTRARQRTYAFPTEMTELMECDGDVHYTVCGVNGRGLLALGHGNDEAILAAFDAFARGVWRQTSLAGDRPLRADDRAGLVRTWVKPITDCGRTGGMSHGDRDCEACASPDWATEYRVRHEHSCWLCAAIKESPWWCVGMFDDPKANAGKAGYLPVTVWRDPADVALEASWTRQLELVDAA